MAGGPNTFGLPRIPYPYASGTIPVDAIIIEDAPSLIGGNADGPAEEIPATVNGTIASRLAGLIGFNAPLALGLPELAANNAYTGSQTIAFVGGLAVSISTTTAGAPSSLANANFLLESSVAGNQGPNLVIRHSPAVAVANSNAGKIIIWGKNDAGTDIRYAQFQGIADTITAGAENGIFGFAAATPSAGGAVGFALRAGGTGVAVGSSVSFMGVNTFNVQSGIYSGGRLISDANATMFRRPYTFGTLPAAAGVQDGFAVITDGAAAPVWNAAAAGGGAVRTPVWSNGAAWNNG